MFKRNKTVTVNKNSFKIMDKNTMEKNFIKNIRVFFK